MDNTRTINRIVAAFAYLVALAVSALLISGAANAAPLDATGLYNDETSRLVCPPKTVPDVSADGLDVTCRDDQDRAHGPAVIYCKNTYDDGLRRRTFYWFNRGVMHGHYKFRDCDADPASSGYESEGYRRNGKMHGQTSWCNRDGKVFYTYTYVNGKKHGVSTDLNYESPDSSLGGFHTKSYYRHDCLYRTEHYDYSNRLFRRCEISRCRAANERCTNYLPGPKAPLTISSFANAADVGGAVVACYYQQGVAVAAEDRSIGIYYADPFAQVRSMTLVGEVGERTATVRFKTRRRTFGTLDKGAMTDATWTPWRLEQFTFKRVGLTRDWVLATCPWR